VPRAIVFDGDDTLWETEPLYDDARRMAREIVQESGLDGARWEELERHMDVDNVKRYGLDTSRFPRSCVEAYDSLCSTVGHEVDPAVRARIESAARTVFDRPAPLVTHARETLIALRARGFRLALLTKGDPILQRRRVEQSGLAHLFDVIEIVDAKTPESIRAVLRRIGAPPSSALSVGNSVRSDVLPSLAAGVRPIWVDAHVWEYERDHDALPAEGVIEIDDLSGLLDVAVA
jgi:putative hydrolase of the HAD superfamily